MNILKKIKNWFSQNQRKISENNCIDNILAEINMYESYADIIKESMNKIDSVILNNVLKTINTIKYYMHQADNEEGMLLEIYLKPDNKIARYKEVILKLIDSDKDITLDLEILNSKSSDDLKKFNDELDKSRKRITSDVINKKKNVELYHKYLKIYNKIFNTELTYENIIKNDSISREVLSKIIERGKNTPTNIANNINEIIDNTKQFIEVKKIFDNKFTYEKASKNEEENSTN